MIYRPATARIIEEITGDVEFTEGSVADEQLLKKVLDGVEAGVP